MSSASCKVLLWILAVMLMFSPQSAEGVKKTTCGQRSAYFNARIVGGRISQAGMWPWQIALYKVPNFHCGGALISRRWVLTAAHCFYEGRNFISKANLYLIKAGDHNLSINETSQQEIVPEKIFVHHKFKTVRRKGLRSFDGDIALVKLSHEVELNEFVRTVCLPKKDEGDPAIPEKKGIVAGWGRTRKLKPYERPSLNDVSKVLRHASFTIQSDKLCLNRSGIHMHFNATTEFCAGDGKGNSDACVGDSGGAFFREGSNSKWVAIGVVSWGNGCAQKGQYGYYTRVYPFLDWIKKTMETEDPSCHGAPSIQNVIITHVTLKEGGEADIKCRTNYTLVGSPKLRCINGGWNDSLPSCKAPCPDPGQPCKGNRIGDNFHHDEKVTFTCPTNYVMAGARTITCTNGSWSN